MPRKPPPQRPKGERVESKAQSVAESKLHELIVQDRIAGLTVGEIADKHQRHRSGIHAILAKHKDQIEAGRTAILEERQEAINKALQDDIETMATLVTKSGRLMLTAVEKLQVELDGDDFKRGTLVMAIDTAIKAFDKVRGVMLAQQKEASKE